LIKTAVAPVTGFGQLASNGQVLLWVEGSETTGDSIHSYNLTTSQETTVIAASANVEHNDIALDGDTLYYHASTGLVGRSLSTGQQQLVSAQGVYPSAAGGKVLWMEPTNQQCTIGSTTLDASGNEVIESKPRCTFDWNLYLRTSSTSTPQLLASQQQGFTGYHVSGDKVTWAEYNSVAHMYTISTGTTENISAEPAANPLVLNTSTETKLVWSKLPTGEIDKPNTSSVQSKTRTSANNTETSSAIVDDSTANVVARAIVDQSRVLYTVDPDLNSIESQMYLTSIAQTGVTYSSVSAANSGGTSQSAPGDAAMCTGTRLPIYCGQVMPLLFNGKAINLYENWFDRWAVHGVQFFLPDYGINSLTFEDGRYQNSIPAINYWLDKARDYLQAKMLRIEIKLPSVENGVVVTPTSYSTIYDFLTRANSRGMRVGIVMHNSNNWNMTIDRENWIKGFIDYFNTSRNGSVWNPVIAYVSAENEINNWCNTRPVDCYDTNPNNYVEQANNWVSKFNKIFKDKNSRILVTVGMSTEMQDSNPNSPTPGENNFFRKIGTAPPLYQSVDFISPHNYGGGGVGIYDNLRTRFSIAGTWKPVVLEEYGWPTDDVHNLNWPIATTVKPQWAEGCFDPTNYSASGSGITPCPNTTTQRRIKNASWFVEENTKALRGAQGRNGPAMYAGGAAFMIADMNAHNCNGSKTGGNVSDLFTGLFSVGGSYCGGTYSTGVGAPKATAFRVRTHHCYYPQGYNVCP
jgi:hypothetical protein